MFSFSVLGFGDVCIGLCKMYISLHFVTENVMSDISKVHDFFKVSIREIDVSDFEIKTE